MVCRLTTLFHVSGEVPARRLNLIYVQMPFSSYFKGGTLVVQESWSLYHLPRTFGNGKYIESIQYVMPTYEKYS